MNLWCGPSITGAGCFRLGRYGNDGGVAGGSGAPRRHPESTGGGRLLSGGPQCPVELDLHRGGSGSFRRSPASSPSMAAAVAVSGGWRCSLAGQFGTGVRRAKSAIAGHGGSSGQEDEVGEEVEALEAIAMA